MEVFGDVMKHSEINLHRKMTLRWALLRCATDAPYCFSNARTGRAQVGGTSPCSFAEWTVLSGTMQPCKKLRFPRKVHMGPERPPRSPRSRLPQGWRLLRMGPVRLPYATVRILRGSRLAEGRGLRGRLAEQAERWSVWEHAGPAEPRSAQAPPLPSFQYHFNKRVIVLPPAPPRPAPPGHATQGRQTAKEQI